MKLRKKKNDNIFIIFIDLTGAYDNFDHEILFNKIKNWKIIQKLINEIIKYTLMLTFSLIP